MVNDIDVSRSVLISGLPSAFLKDNADDFAETIYEILETTFSLTRDAIDHLIRSPLLDPHETGFGCKCLISFRSRVHRHRVIAQKSKLESPTVISSITEVPRDILDSSEEVLEVTDEWAEDNGIQVREVKRSVSSIKAASTTQKKNLTETIADPIKKTSPSAKPNLDEYADDDEDIVLVEEDNASTVENPVVRTDSNANKLVTPNGGQKSIDKFSVEEDDMLELPPLSPIDKHQKQHFSKLRVNWDGAPEFQWRTVSEDDQKQLLKIENVVPSDIHNPWIYPVVLSACRMEMDFPRLSFNEVGNFSLGKIDLYFLDDNTLVSCALNYLVYLRTSRGRRAKIFLPHTKPVLKFGKSLEKRLGHVRAPTPSMCQLLVKPLPDNVTEKEIRNDAFPYQTITKVEFKRDLLKQRCAIVTFASAEHAITAHCRSNYVVFEKADGNDNVATVLYPSVAVPDWDEGENLLVATEMKKQNVESSSPNKEKRTEQQKKKEPTQAKKDSGAAAKSNEQIKEPVKKQESEQKVTEKTATKEKSKEMGKRDVRANTAGKRTSTSISAGPGNKVPRIRNYSYRGSSFAARGAYTPMKHRSWRGGPNIQPLLSVGSSYAYNGPAHPVSEFNYSGPYGPPERRYRGSEEKFVGGINDGGLRYTSSWRNEYGTRGIRGPIGSSYREEAFPPEPGVHAVQRPVSGAYREEAFVNEQEAGKLFEEHMREQREKLAYKEQMLRQQKLIDDLEKQLRAQTQLSGGYIGSFEERTDSAVTDNYRTAELVPKAAWNTPGLPTNCNERINQLW